MAIKGKSLIGANTSNFEGTGDAGGKKPELTVSSQQC
jgi:hypothetical protein